MTPLADSEARRRIAEDLDATLLVEAAAGTGKTTELVARIVALVREGRAGIDGILAVTYTDKAAGEMKLRLRGELEKALQAAPTAAARERLGAALAQLEEAQIGTIHSVCADLLREWPIEAGVDPLFEVAPGEVAERLYQQAFDEWFARSLADPPEGVRRLLRRRPRGRDAEGPRELLRSAGWDLCDHRDFDGAYRRDAFDRAQGLREVLSALGELSAFAPRAQRPDDWLAKALAELYRFTEDVARRQALRGTDDDGLEAELRELSHARHWNWRGKGRFFCEGVERETVSAQREGVQKKLQAFLRDADADLAACLREELRPLVAGYEERKARAGCLDFLDLLFCASRLVRTSAPVLAELRARVRHVLVDEFQDTDPLQAELLFAIAGDRPGGLFAVGDPKQSIYRFRRADLALYEDVKKTLLARGAELLYLTTSFRAAPAIQEAINGAFALQMKGQPGQAQYVPLTPFRAAEPGQPAVVALPAPRTHGDRGYFAKFRVEESYPDAVGAFVDWLLTKSGWQVTEEGERVPVEARHVCLLFKRMQSFGNDLSKKYIEALEAREVRHVLVGGRSYHAREEVLALRNAASAIERPDDELAVFATLRGPLFALSDDSLLTFRGEQGSFHPLRPLDAGQLSETSAEVAEALLVLRRLHHGRNRRPIADTLLRLLRETRAHAGLAIWPSGEQALANALRVLDLARRFESAGATSFRAFVDRLDAEEARGDAGEAPAVEEGAEGVRIMSVHRAKGLEFPVVILCDPTAPPAPRNPSRHLETERRLWAMPLAGCAPKELEEHRAEALERDRAETVRLAYVAATRARDLLVVPFVMADSDNPSWLESLRPAIEPKPELRQGPEAAPGCPPFGREGVVLDESDDPRFGSQSGSTRPGLHVPQAGEHRVVIWDPRALELGKELASGRRRETLLEDDQAGVATAGTLAHQEWANHRAAALGAGARPAERLTTATALAASAQSAGASAPPVRLESVGARDPRRPSGKRFGTLLHAVLAEADLRAPQAALDRVAAAQGRLIGASDAEVAAAARAAGSALAHPLLQRAARSLDCRREAPLWLRGEDGALIEGVADLAFREKGRWVVVDFKSDARPETQGAYAVQLSLYVKAISQATGEAAEGVLFAV